MRAFAIAVLLAVLAVLGGESALAQAEKRFQRSDLAAAATRVEAQLRADRDPGGRPAAVLVREAEQAASRNDWRAAARLFSAAAQAEPQNIGLLLRLTDAYGRIDARNDWRERSDLQNRMTAVPFLAYQRARTPADEARALSVLGDMYARQNTFRPALDALRVSLETQEVPAVRARYDALLEQHGFRILDYRVDSDTASPRVCFQLSESLPPRLDASPFVQMPGGVPGAVVADGEQLCVDGLKHGERYEITLRQGLPSVVREATRQASNYTIYVRDRTPAVRFTGRNYVMPRTGQQGVPVVAVNLPEVALAIYRFGDRSVAQTVLDEAFLGQVTGEAAREVGSRTGAEVWSGRLRTDVRLNEEVVTAFPITEALGANPAPGIYLLVARRGDQREGTDDFEQRATQWLVVSDLGLGTLWAEDGMHVTVRSLASARLQPGVEVRLVARNNEILATARTDATGRVRFDAGLTRGRAGSEPGVVVAQMDNDYAVLSLAASPFDLTDRGVAGRVAPGALDAFLTTERGVYRTGETVHLTTILRDTAGNAPSRVPLTLVLERPDGVELRRTVSEDAGSGGRIWSVTLPPGAPTGTWRIRALADPRRPAIGQVSFMVEDYVPDRIEFDLTTQATSISGAQPLRAAVAGRWLFGAPAAELTLEGEVIVTPGESAVEALRGYRVGLADEEVAVVRRPLDDLPRTDAQGRATLLLALPQLPTTSRPLRAEFIVRMSEGSGRGVERKLTLPVFERRPLVGVRPRFEGAVGDGDIAGFDVLTVGADGRPAAQRAVRWEISRVETRFQWFRVDGRWNFESVRSARRVADGRIDVAAGQPARVEARVEWGRYRLDVTTADGAATSVTFDAGFAGGLAADAPDVLEVALDKATYAAGEEARLRVTSRFAGEASIDIVADTLRATRNVTLREGANTIPIPVPDAMGAGAYVLVTAVRPLDAQARRMPGRAIGLAWMQIGAEPRTLGLTLEAPAQARPRETLRVPVRVSGVDGGTAFVTVSAVDVGILNLTNFRAPDPVRHIFGQRALGAELRDIYGFLIDGMQGNVGRIRSGGDGPPPELAGSPPAEAPLALFSGVVPVGADGTAVVEFALPPFAGSVRLTAVAWSENKVGAATRDVIVRDPLVLTGTLPRFMAAGDRSRFLLEVQNVEGPAGTYTVSVDPVGPIVLPAGALRQTLQLAPGERRALTIPVTAVGQGTASLDVVVEGPAGAATGRTYALGLRPANPTIQRRTVRTLAANGGSITLGPDLLADVVPGTGAVSIAVGPLVSFDVPAKVLANDLYPFACTEQLVSRALPLISLGDLVDERQLGLSAPIQEIVRGVIERVVARQSSNGAFGLWGIGGDDLWLDAYVADFLGRARDRGYEIPRVAYDLVLDRLRNAVQNSGDGDQGDDAAAAHAYALFVLARAGRPVIGDLRYLADAKRDEIGSPLAQAQVAAALALFGDRQRAQPVFAAAVQALADDNEPDTGRADFGSRLRDGAGLIALMHEAQADGRLIQRAISIVDRLRGERRYTSTQENTWLVMAARAAREQAAGLQLTVDGRPLTGPFQRTLRERDIARGDLVVANPSGAPVRAVVTITGSPVTPEPRLSNGFTIERTYFRADGTRVDPRRVRQNERMVVVLTVTEPEPAFGRIIVTDPLPAGFEIDNPALVDSARLTGLPAGDDPVRPVSTEFRDDRFAAAFDRNEGQAPRFAVAYIVRATAPGSYAHPGPVVEDMYRPERVGRGDPGTVEVEAR